MIEYIYIHYLLQFVLISVWLFTLYNVVRSKKSLPLRLYSTLLILCVLMMYIVTTNLTVFNEQTDTIIWNRLEWYVFDIMVSYLINQITCKSRQINNYLNWFANKKEIK